MSLVAFINTFIQLRMLLAAPEDPFSLPLESCQSSTAVGWPRSVRCSPVSHRRIAIRVTQRLVESVHCCRQPFSLHLRIAAVYFIGSLDVQKVVSARLVETLEAAYKNHIGYASSFFGDMSKHLL